MYRLGWRTFREHVMLIVPRHRLRFAMIVGVLAALATAVLSVLVALAHDAFADAPVRVPIGLVLLALGVGVTAGALTPFGPRVGPERQVRATAIQQPTGRVERYVTRVMPPVEQADRAIVLDETLRLRNGLVPQILRLMLLGPGWVLGVSGFLIAGAEPAFVFVALTLSTVGFHTQTTSRLGQSERARAAAEALPDLAPEPPRAGRNRFPSGSKLALPDD